MKKHGGNVHEFSRKYNINIDEIIDFSANINPLGLSSRIKSSYDDIFKSVLNYPDPTYYALKESIGKFEQLPVENITLGNGAIECIFMLANALARKHLMIQAPTFIEYERGFHEYDITHYVTEAPFKVNINNFINSIPETCDVIILCNPNNPTGHLIEKQDLITLLNLCEKRDIILIIDEAFIDFTDDEKKNSMISETGSECLVVLKSLTKFYSIPGLRMGYLVTSNQAVHRRIDENRMPWSINSIAEACTKIMLEDVSYIKETKEFVQTERAYLVSQLRQFEYLEVYETQGNYIFFKSLHKNLHDLLATYGIMVRNCNNYIGLRDGYYRVAVKSRNDNDRLIEVMRNLNWK